MNAGELLAKLNHLTLVGCENGELIWMGTERQWREAELPIIEY